MATNGQPPPKSPEDKEIPLGYPEYLDLYFMHELQCKVNTP